MKRNKSPEAGLVLFFTLPISGTPHPEQGPEPDEEGAEFHKGRMATIISRHRLLAELKKLNHAKRKIS
jgi:hypothetical protein